MKLFKSKFTKWIPLGNHEYAGVDYITFVRKNIKTGMMEFKTKRVNTNNPFDTSVHSVLNKSLINVSEAWNKITEM